MQIPSKKADRGVGWGKELRELLISIIFAKQNVFVRKFGDIPLTIIKRQCITPAVYTSLLPWQRLATKLLIKRHYTVFVWMMSTETFAVSIDPYFPKTRFFSFMPGLKYA